MLESVIAAAITANPPPPPTNWVALAGLVCGLLGAALGVYGWRRLAIIRDYYERILALDKQRYETIERYAASVKYLFEKQQRLIVELLATYVDHRCAGCNRFRSDRLWCDELQRSTSPSGFCHWHEDKRDEQDKDQPGADA